MNKLTLLKQSNELWYLRFYSKHNSNKHNYKFHDERYKTATPVQNKYEFLKTGSNEKYHNRNKVVHGDNFDHKALYPFIIKNPKTLVDLQEEYEQLIKNSTSKENMPPSKVKNVHDKVKDFSLGVD
ncbi:hypothetical protein DLAC_02329 [Tieghemostelium lacteum]|uniref:Uncharacterized protein n=1 Tax=Tieghemostelium lacteum TaxID=361077 RepID=A0A152A551_TIELA|nr:hypothetical protein DLAC_02329 [Tieghemostelium lacteum]|eukprot:KYR01211.1 hypothetical protein DLAC_02329 [Tieghemostelium lacteum]